MEFTWITAALNDLIWIGLTFLLGLFSKKLGLPPMVGFLAAGFLLSSQGMVDKNLLKNMADLGITLLLFTIGLKIKISNLIRPQVWAVTTIHSSIVIAVISTLIYTLAWLGTALFADFTAQNALLIAFAFSFSSTVFVVKAMEEKGEMNALHGRIAIGVLVIQDIFAVVFLAASANKLPSIWALLLLLLIPLRFVFYQIIKQIGRGELMVLFGFLLAIGGAELFELVSIKGDLGALILGMLLATQTKADELAKSMLKFKDLFLIGFFLSIGFSGMPNTETIVMALLITPLIFLKSALFFTLFIKFKLRARTALLSTINLSNYSEFGLIVIAIGVANNWIESQWLIIMAVSLAFSFIVSAVLNKYAHRIYRLNRSFWKNFQSNERLPYDQILDLGDAEIAIFGMGTVGTGAYDQLIKAQHKQLVGVDISAVTVKNQCVANRHVMVGDPSDADFWDRINQTHQLKLVLLTLPHFNTSLAVVKLLHEMGYKGKIAATAKYPDEIEQLNEAGVDTVFNIFTEAGAGFAAHVVNKNNQKIIK